MGILSFLTGRHADEEPEPSDFEQGAAFARDAIDERRQNYEQYGYSSFQESVQCGGEIWHDIVQKEQAFVDQGHTERQARLNYARGARSLYD